MMGLLLVSLLAIHLIIGYIFAQCISKYIHESPEQYEELSLFWPILLIAFLIRLLGDGIIFIIKYFRELRANYKLRKRIKKIIKKLINNGSIKN